MKEVEIEQIYSWWAGRAAVVMMASYVQETDIPTQPTYLPLEGNLEREPFIGHVRLSTEEEEREREREREKEDVISSFPPCFPNIVC